ncbi:unnamed protein product [Rotaria magnacalcarata]|uniref:Uncharacterized protein n=2 Tax=Rotaria magnacalcarata TaxID=392030 RepID=A0A816NDZ9_9BILA|nr:unnamed protein product [Rotaria magnacalcarata]CAF2225165.1 unnamed protein product [Rotaria magnacalcarata]CAF3971923.1 unnamed protein product [Rotaria magnacalcarata]CAF4115188.1 unnamed protein product [Rotaria magnacalcarata]
MYLLALFSLLLLLNNEINAKIELPATYPQSVLSHCSINNYSSWLEQKESLTFFLQLARFLALDTKRIERQISIYVLQDRCLKQFETPSPTIGRE